MILRSLMQRIQTTKTLPCYKTIPVGKTEHEGGHIHQENVAHTCEIKCPGCLNYCKLPTGHTSLHDTDHGNMVNAHFAGAAGSKYMLDNFIYSAGNDARVFLCSTFCNNLGRHKHITFCEENRCTKVESRNAYKHIDTKDKIYPEPDRQKDYISHVEFWRRSGFADPYNTRLEFSLCDHHCSHDDHKKSKSPSYCVEPLFHMKIARTGDKSDVFVSKVFALVDGHRFTCEHVNFAACQICVVIDFSYSMTSSDILPPPTPDFAYKLKKHLNRLGAVFHDLCVFLRSRIAATSTSSKSKDVNLEELAKNETLTHDSLTVVKFNLDVEEIKEPMENLHAYSLLDILVEQPQPTFGDGTNFTKAFQYSVNLMKQKRIQSQQEKEKLV
ncbi:hypothetical protein HK098_004124 [Nowakowskiella sp. JEL0407]|nr:hypothetical protein HK098_004124 [Nowakowskiella sp. JEL0407]